MRALLRTTILHPLFSFLFVSLNVAVQAQSQWVFRGQDGKRRYKRMEKGDRIMDFSLVRSELVYQLHLLHRMIISETGCCGARIVVEVSPSGSHIPSL